MTYNRALWLPAVLRAAGLTVVEHDGWRTRGLSEARPFNPRAVVWHHDASALGDSPGVPGYMIREFLTHGAQLWVDRSGRWHIIASGRAAHAGAVRPGAPTNETSLGIETDHTTGETWPVELLASLRKGTAAILDHLDTTPSAGLHFHKSICEPVGRKVDPDGLDLNIERRLVARVMAPNPVPVAAPSVSLARLQRAARRSDWTRGLPGFGSRDSRRVRAALKAERCGSYAAWQRKLGYSGRAADGVPGKTSLSTLGRRHGFKVAR